MHKKPLVAVFVLGLLLVASAIGWAVPNPPEDGVFPIASGPSKGAPAQRVDETGTAISLQLGTPLSVQGTFCNGYWQGPQTYRVPGWMTGSEAYAVFQDPTSTYPYSFGTGCDAMIPPDVTFNVTSTLWRWTKRPTSEGFVNPYTYQAQPIVFDADFSDPSCPVPGGVKCAGAVFVFTLNNTNASGGVTYELNLPFTVECCVEGPYFIGAYLPVLFASNNGAQLLFDDGTFLGGPVLGQLCRTYNDYGAGWCDLNDPAQCAWFELNLLMWSEGYLPLDPATQCTPGICGPQIWYGADIATGYGVSGTSTRREMGVRYMSDCQDTLKSVEFYLVGSLSTSPLPNILVRVYLGDGVGTSCGLGQLPGTLLETVLIPGSSVQVEPLTNVVTFNGGNGWVWGVLNGGLPQAIYVTIEVPPDQAPLSTAIRGCQPELIGSCAADPHSLGFYVAPAALPGWHYLGEVPTAFTQREFKMTATICKEQCPIVEDACSPAGPDSWPTWGHDYQRTSSSSMNLGDPCLVRAQWSSPMPRINSFTNPVIAGGKVYVSSDQEVNSYDLATGAPGASVGVFPYTSGQVRSNVSVVGNRVFMTGGTALSISCWDTTLTTNFWSNDALGNPAGPTLLLNGPLKARNRFGTTAVYVVGLDSVVVVGTESPATGASGWLYALNAIDGKLYAGWGTNPIPLDRGIYHSPAYDGANLYVGTGEFGTFGDGSLYSFSAATGGGGVPNWNYKDALAPLEGWPGGVSVDGSFLYGATYYSPSASVGTGHRYKIDKSGAGPVVMWRFLEGPTLYAAPTIGRNFVYIPQDAPSAGVLMVDKALGKAAYNWAADGVGSVSQNVTLTCDMFLFAGDRFGYWWLLNASDQSVEWRREFTGIVNGTALAHHAITGDDYAVVSARSAVSLGGAGVVTAWRFNQPGPRSFMHQYVYETPEILVPLNSGMLGPYTETGVYGNDGCAPLFFTSTYVWDVSPSVANYTKLQRQYAAAFADRKVGSDWVTYFDGGKPSKRAIMSGALTSIDGELSALDVAIGNAYQARSAKGGRGVTAAGASRVPPRTQLPVTYSSNPVPPGGFTNMSWNYDGTGLGRGVDDELIESWNTDPDFYPEDLTYGTMGYPTLLVHYVGGCPNASTPLVWNTLGATNTEKVYNYGTLGGQNANGDHALKFGADPTASDAWMFDGGLFVTGDSSSAIGGALVRIGVYDVNLRNFVADPRASDATCGFDQATDILMGYRRDGGCPGQPVAILGSWIQSNYADTLEAVAPTSPLACMGLSIKQTEIGANDPMYGDFKLIRWNFHNRDAVAKSNLYAGTFIDWDIAAGSDNIGSYRDDYNGYYLRATTSPITAFAYGMFVPDLYSDHCGINPVPDAPHRIEVVSNATRVYASSSPPGAWTMTPPTGHPRVYNEVVNQLPLRGTDDGVTPEDRSGLLVNKPFNLAANGDFAMDQALYAVSAFGGNDVSIGNAGAAVAKRAARWAGYARGDVNDDGCINLADVCWMVSGNQIYPDTYSADVDLAGGQGDAADFGYLLAYVSGTGPAPLGAWRFTY